MTTSEAPLYLFHSSSSNSTISDIVTVENSSISLSKDNTFIVIQTPEGDIIQYYYSEGIVHTLIIDGFRIEYTANDQIAMIYDNNGVIVFENNITATPLLQPMYTLSSPYMSPGPSLVSDVNVTTASDDDKFVGKLLGIIGTPPILPTINYADYPEWVNNLTEKASIAKEQVSAVITHRLEIAQAKIQTIVDNVGSAGEYIVETFQNIDLPNIPDVVQDIKEYLPRTNAAMVLRYLDEYLLHYHLIGSNTGENTDADSAVDTLDAFPTDPNETEDTDYDGTGDNADLDDDNDGVLDTQDAFPKDPSRTTDGTSNIECQVYTDRLTGCSVYTYWSTTGAIQSEIPYLNYVIEGTWKTYREDGTLDNATPYINGVKEGIQKWYYASGTIFMEIPYLNNVKEGLWKNYREDGTLITESPYVNGIREGIDKAYNSTGSYVLIETPYVNGVKEGIQKWYYASGALSSTYIYVNDLKNGISTQYLPDGSIAVETPYVNDVIHGTKYNYNSDGSLAIETPYVNGVIDGTKYSYNSDGSLYSSQLYINGIGQDIIYY